MVVAPYNAQVRELRRLLPDGVRVGTVDKLPGPGGPGGPVLDGHLERRGPARAT